MDAFVANFVTAEFVMVAVVAGVLVEAAKRVVEMLSTTASESRWFKAGLAVSPLIVGATLALVLMDGATATRLALGAVAGSMAGTVYDAVVKPIKAKAS